MYKGKKRHVLLSFFLVFLMALTSMFHGQQFVFAHDNVPEDERFNLTEHKEMTLGITNAGYEQDGVFITLPRTQAVYDAREHQPASLTTLTLDLSFQVKRDVLLHEMQNLGFFKVQIPEVMVHQDVKTPVEVFQGDVLLGKYTIKEQVLTFHFEDMTNTTMDVLMGTIPLQVSLGEDVFTKDEKEVVFALQKETNISFLLPAQQEKQSEIIKQLAMYRDNVNAASPSANATDTTIVTYLPKQLPEGIEKIVIKLTSQKDGYISSSTNLHADFAMDIVLDDDYLYEKFDEYLNLPGCPHYDGSSSYPEYLAAVEAFFNQTSDEDVPPLSYTFPLGENAKPEKMDDEYILKYTSPATGELTRIGVMKFVSNEATNEVFVSIVFDKVIFTKESVVAGGSLGLEVNKEKLHDTIYHQVYLDERGIILKPIEQGGGGEEPTPQEEPYTLVKSARVMVNEPMIEYTIQAQAADKQSLNDMILNDQIQTGFEVSKVSVRYNEEASFQTLSANDYRFDNHLLSYTIKSEDTITKAEFKVEVSMDQASYKNYLETGSVNTNVKNKALLYKKDNPNPAASSDEITTKMNMKLITKDGSQDSTDGTIYHWAVTINTTLVRLKDAYFRDFINHDAHVYALEKGMGNILIYEGKRPLKVYKKEDVLTKTVDDADFDRIIHGTAAQVKALLGNEKPYIVQTEDGQQAAFILPYEEFANKEITIKYDTVLNVQDGTVDDYFQENTVSITNDANFVWDEYEYHGIIGKDVLQSSVNLKKEYQPALVLGSKDAYAYDEHTHTLTWRFKVNTYGGDRNDIRIRDDLGSNHLLPVMDGGDVVLTYTKLNRKDQVLEKGSIANDDTLPIYYTMDNNNVLEIYIKDVKIDEYYEILLKTKINDVDVFAQQSNTGIVTNKASISGTLNGEPKEQEITAHKTIPNTLIKKNTIGTYNYQEDTLKWKLVLNEHDIYVKDAIITDTLPIGNTLLSIDTITMVKADGSKHVAQTSDHKTFTVEGTTITLKDVTSSKVDDGSGQTYDQGSFALAFQETDKDYIEESYIIEYTSIVSDKTYKDKIMKDTQKGTDFLNKASLSGSIVSFDQKSEVAIHANVKAEATHHAVGLLPEKTGEFSQKDGSIVWTIAINKNKVDSTGLQVIENLSACQNCELDPDSFILYKATVLENGDLDSKFEEIANYENTAFMNQITLNPTIDLVQVPGFIFHVPASIGQTNLTREALVLRFTTYFTDSTGTRDVVNQVNLQYADGKQQNSDISNGSMDQDFNMDKYIQARPKPVLRIMKTSSNTITDKFYGLAGAEFMLEALLEEDQNPGTYTVVPKYSKTGTTSANGTFAFMNLKNDYLYRITETKAPDGYEKSQNVVRYVKFTTTGSTQRDQTLQVNGQTITYDLISASDFTAKDLETVVTNDPDTNIDIKFSKIGANQELLTTDVAFVLRNHNALLNDFASTISGNQIVFEDVDPGTYDVIEVKAPGAYDIGSIFEVQVNVDGTYTIQDKKGNQNAKVSETNGNYTIQDSYIKGSISVKKVDDGTQVGLQGAKFQLFTYDGLHPLKDSAGKDITAASNKDGIAKFNNIPFQPDGYAVKEIAAPEGYKVSGTTIITITSQEVMAAIRTNDALHTKTFVVDKTSSAFANALLKANLEFQKNDEQNRPLAGIVFSLVNSSTGNVIATTHSDSDGRMTFTNIPYPRIGNDFVTYQIKETPQPGYSYPKNGVLFTFSKGDVTITKDALGNPDSYIITNQASTKLVNQYQRTSFMLQKTNQDQEPMEGVAFELTRRGSSPAQDGSLDAKFQFVEANNNTDYVPYLPTYDKENDTVLVTDKNGQLRMDDLLAGDYQLKEISPNDIQDGSRLVDVKFSISMDASTGVYSVTKDGEAINVSGTRYNLGTYVNEKKYGFVQVHKVRGENTGTTITVSEQAIANAEFTIYKNTVPYLTLRTNRDGKFDVNTDGTYTDIYTQQKRHLFYGDYTIQETKAPALYQKDDTKYSFTIGETTTQHLGTAWIARGEATPTYIKEKETGILPAFVNIPNRGKVTLEKSDGNTTLLNDGEFIIYHKQTVLASMKVDNTGIYHLSNEKAQGVYEEVSQEGIPYLQKINEEYYLLEGSYTLKEVKAPSGYKLMDQSIDFVVNADGSVSVQGNVLINNQLRMQNTATTFQVLKISDERDAQQQEIMLADAAFKIYTVDAQGNKGEVAKDRDGNEFAWVSITKAQKLLQLPAGDYILSEEKAPYGYLPSKDIRITMDEKGVLSSKDANIKVENGDYTIRIVNTHIKGHVNLHKKDTANQSLANIHFDLYKFNIQNSTYQLIAKDLVTDQDGQWTSLKSTTINLDTSKSLSDGLLQGKYRLLETKSDDDHYLPDPTQNYWDFEVTDANHYDIHKEAIQVEASNDFLQANVSFVKSDVDTGKAIAGVVFHLLKDGDSNPQTFVSDEYGIVHLDNLSKGDYTLREMKSAPGYIYPSGVEVTFTITNEDYQKKHEINAASIQGVNPKFKISSSTQIGEHGILNKATHVEIWKQDALGNTLEGATLKITGTFADAQMQEYTWISGQSVKELHALLLCGETYEIREVSAPDGYTIMTPIQFVINQNGEVVIDNTIVKDNQLILKNEQTKIDVVKVDHLQQPFIGAQFAIYDGDTLIEEWMSDGTPHTIQGKLHIQKEYVLKENATVSGYTFAAPTYFHLDAQGNLIIDQQPAMSQTITIQNTQTSISILKNDDANKPLAHAQFVIVDAQNQEVASWESDTTEYVIQGILNVNEVYTIQEKASPDGYTIAQPITFSLNKDGQAIVNGEPLNNNAFILNNQKTKLVIDKQDEEGNSLAGAQLAILDKNQNEVATWMSDGTPYEIVGGLKVLETYTLKEVTSPNGHTIAQPMTFTLQSDGTLFIDNKVSHDNTIVLKNAETKISISKVDEQKQPLSDATLAIYDEQGKKLTDWISGQKPYELIGTLDVNRTYTLQEISAPNGYTMAPSIDFMIDGEGRLIVDGKAVQDNRLLLENVQTQMDILKVDEAGTPLAGAAFVILDQKQNEIDTWTSTEQAHHITGILNIKETYTLHEVKAPFGYTTMKDIQFYVDEQGNIFVEGVMVDKNQLIVQNQQTSISILKTDADGKPLRDATLEIVDHDGDVVETWTSGQDAHNMIGKLEVEADYQLRELASPSGYTVADAIDFHLDKDGNVIINETSISGNIITMKNAQSEVAIQKQDGEGNALSDAQLQIVDEKGNLVYAWTSRDTVEVMTGLLEVNKPYTLQEKASPAGYAISQDITFMLDEKGQMFVGKDAVNGNIYTLVNEQTKLTIQKVTEDGQPLSGAELEIQDAKGQIIDTWVSSDSVHELIGKLIVGETYTLQETASPSGYQIAYKQEFTLRDDGQLMMNGSEVKHNHIAFANTQTKISISKVDEQKQPLSDATLAIYDEQGKKLTDWISGQKPYELIGTLDVNRTYTLQEISAPNGYTMAPSIDFMIDGEGRLIVDGKAVQDNRLLLENVQTQMDILKVDEAGTPLAGAAFVILDQKQNEIDTWTSTEQAHHITGILNIKETYTLHEVKAPFGYTTMKDIQFYVDEQGNIFVEGVMVDKNQLVVQNQQTSISILKTDADGKPLHDATLEIVDHDGDVVETWTSGQDAHNMIGKLEVEADYQLRELASPSGYTVADAIDFHLDKDGNVIINKTSVSGNIITMKNVQTVVTIQKTDEQNRPLANAQLELLNQDGRVVHTWTSSNAAEAIIGVLQVNQTYTIHEVAAPAGYQIADDITFTVANTADEQMITFVNIQADDIIVDSSYHEKPMMYMLTGILSFLLCILAGCFIALRKQQKNYRRK